MRHRVKGSLACAWMALSFACSHSAPPPRAAEVPIDQFQAGPATAGASQAAPAAEVVAEPVAPAAPGAHAAPVQLPTPAPAPTATTPPLPPGERLSGAECGKLMDRAAVLLGVNKGMSFAKAAKALATLRKQAQADASIGQVQASCSDHVSKAQYQCGVKATSLDGWRACVTE